MEKKDQQDLGDASQEPRPALSAVSASPETGSQDAAPSSRPSTRSRGIPPKSVRHEIYKHALVRFDERQRSLCPLIDRAVREIINPNGGSPAITDRLPELQRIKASAPRKGEAFWWTYDDAGFAARRRALLKMIEMTRPALGVRKDRPKATPKKKKS